MVLLRNTAEGGTPGQAVTVANSGGASGDPFSQVNSVAYSAQNPRGSVCLVPSGNASSVVYPGGAVKAFAARFYIRLAQTPTAAGIICVGYTNNTTTHAGRLVVNTSRQIAIQNTNTTTVATLTAHALAIDVWYRVELQVLIGDTAGSGTFRVQLFVGDDTTPVATYTNNGGATTGTPPMTSLAIGRVSGTGWGTGPYFDDVAFQDSATAIGPPKPDAPGQFLLFF